VAHASRRAASIVLSTFGFVSERDIDMNVDAARLEACATLEAQVVLKKSKRPLLPVAALFHRYLLSML
jgi:hypothetical protein